MAMHPAIMDKKKAYCPDGVAYKAPIRPVAVAYGIFQPNSPVQIVPHSVPEKTTLSTAHTVPDTNLPEPTFVAVEAVTATAP